MVTKNQATAKKRGKIKVGKLKVNKETVKDLSKQEGRGIKAGLGGSPTKTVAPPSAGPASACRAGFC
jgi:hypothetical protein